MVSTEELIALAIIAGVAVIVACFSFAFMLSYRSEANDLARRLREDTKWWKEQLEKDSDKFTKTIQDLRAEYIDLQEEVVKLNTDNTLLACADDCYNLLAEMDVKDAPKVKEAIEHALREDLHEPFT